MTPALHIFYIIGMMGVGKSSIGLTTAIQLDIPFIDLDDYIRKQEKKTITQIFKESGEAGFRQKESKYLKKLDFGNHQFGLVTTGGGTAIAAHNLSFMEQTGTLIWLDTPIELIIERLKEEKDDRPLLAASREANFEQHIRNMYAQRIPVYSRATIRINNIGYDYEAVAELENSIRSLMKMLTDSE